MQGVLWVREEEYWQNCEICVTKEKESNPRKMATPLRKCEVTTKMD